VKLRSSAHLRVVPRAADFAVYHRIYGGLFLVDRPGLDLLGYFETPRTEEDACRDHPELEAATLARFLDFCTQRRVLVQPEADEEAIVADRARARERDLVVGRQIRIVQLVLANRCNFKCTYCFEGLGATPLSETIYAHSTPERLEAQASRENSIMRPEQAEAYLESAIRLAKRAGNEALAVQFFGGEPLVNWRTIQRVLDRFGHEHDGVSLGYSIITNGSLISDEVAQAFHEFDVPVVVSYDSPKSDARPLRGGQNSHDVIRRGLERLRRHDNRVVLNSVLGESTFEIFGHDLVDFAFDNGIWEIGVVLDLDPVFYERRSANEIVDRLWEVCAYGRSKGVIVTGYWHQIFQGIATHDRYDQIGFSTCSAMGAQLSIEPTGDVFSCKASGGYFGTILAPEELLASETYRTYAMRAVTSPEPCTRCPLEHFCAGMCLGPVENRNDHDISQVEEAACDVYRAITRRFVETATAADVPVFFLDAGDVSVSEDEPDVSWSLRLASLTGVGV
jgi:uncharacterized protein